MWITTLSKSHSHTKRKEKTLKKISHKKVNYKYSNNDDVINMVEFVDFEYYNVIMIKGKQENTKPKISFILRGATSTTTDKEPSQSCANIVTHSHAKIVLKGPPPSTPKSEQYKEKPLVGPSRNGTNIATYFSATSYNILDQLN